jgi:hypothetical protein
MHGIDAPMQQHGMPICMSTGAPPSDTTFVELQAGKLLWESNGKGSGAWPVWQESRADIESRIPYLLE